MKKATVAILGGSFDPPHSAHLFVAELVKNFADEVWIIPCGPRPDKPKLTSYDMRLQMCRQAFPSFFVSNFEEEKSMIPTYLLISQISEIYNDKIFSFVIGVDLLESLHTWHSAGRLINEVNFLVVNRGGYNLTSRIQEEYMSRTNFTLVDSQLKFELSSTAIRLKASEVIKNEEDRDEKVAKINSILGIPQVSQFIVQNNLYINYSSN
jgi:nicotinate-nucleotide adenylyltransferase